MTDLKLYTKLSALPLRQKAQVAEFIDSLNPHTRSSKLPNRKAGKANGLIEMKENFDDPIPGFDAEIL